jgi:hypothetical protein
MKWSPLQSLVLVVLVTTGAIAAVLHARQPDGPAGPGTAADLAPTHREAHPEAPGDPTTLVSARWEGSDWLDGIARDYWCNSSTIDPRVIPAAEVGWPGPGNVLSLRNTAAGCGGFLLERVFPPPGPGVRWAWRYYYMQGSDQVYTHMHGLGDLNPVGSIDLVFHSLTHLGGPDGAFLHGMRAPPALWGWEMQTTTAGGQRAKLQPDTWYQFSFVLEWVTDQTYRVWPEVRTLDGTLIADHHHYRSEETTGYPRNIMLPDFYSRGGLFQRRSSGDDVRESVRNFYFGVAQSRADAGRMNYAALDLGTTSGPHFGPAH